MLERRPIKFADKDGNQNGLMNTEWIELFGDFGERGFHQTPLPSLFPLQLHSGSNANDVWWGTP